MSKYMKLSARALWACSIFVALSGSLAVRADAIDDTRPPTIYNPGDIYAVTTEPSGTTVSYSVYTYDDIDPSPVVICDHPSGSLFPMGSTPVSCFAQDASGNMSGSVFFNVIVQPPLQLTAQPVTTTVNARSGHAQVSVAIACNRGVSYTLGFTLKQGPPAVAAEAGGNAVRYCTDAEYLTFDLVSTKDAAFRPGPARIDVYISGCSNGCVERLSTINVTLRSA